MIHILTVHWKYDFFIETQLKYIKKNIKNYKIWAAIDSIPHTKNFDQEFHFYCDTKIQKTLNEMPFHASKLKYLFEKLIKDKNTKDDDVVVFMDNDAWPINPLNSFIEESLKQFQLGAVMRHENAGDSQPHPCFCFTTVGFFKKNNLNWSYGNVDNKNFPNRQDVGGFILQYFKKHNIKWKKLLRTSSLFPHDVLYGIYENLIYHHGAGSRAPITMQDMLKKNKAPSRNCVLDNFEKIKSNENIFKI